MSKGSQVRWGKWIAAITGALLALKSCAYVVSRLFAVAKHEVQARGGDVDAVLALAGRRRTSRGH